MLAAALQSHRPIAIADYDRKNTAVSYAIRRVTVAKLNRLLGLLLAALSAPALAADPTLMAAYGFEEGTGVTVLDVSGNSNTGSISGASWTAAGKNGSALSFDGVNDRVFVASSSSLNVTTALTVEAWVFPTAAQGGWRTVVQKEVDAYLLHASSNAGALRPAAGGTYAGAVSSFSAPSAIAVNAWTHLAQTYDGSIVRMYINGVQVASAAHSGALETNNNPLSIGGTAAYGEYFLGRIDDVRIYSRVLSAAEIQTDMSTAVGGTPPPPDTQAPSAPSGLSATAVSSTQISLSWTAATDNVGVTNYLIERCIGAGCSNFSQIATTGGTTFNNTTLLASTSYSYRVRATDAAGNQGGYSNTASATTLAGGQLAATVVNPLEGSTQAGTIALSAVASGDNVAGVRFQVDGVDIGPADTVAPYTQSLNTGGFANGTHTITARTWDTLGNSATSAGVSVAFSNASPGNPAATGLWLGTINWPLSAVHAHLLPDGRVLVSDAQSFAGTDAKVWDPATDRFVNATALDNIFCAGHAALPDGRLLVVGGHVTAHVGIADANIFNPQTNSWSAAATMQFARWYPTLTPLPDGRMLVQSGESNCNGCEVTTPEIYNPANNTWTSLSTAAQYFPYYPHTYVLPDGRVLVASTTRAMIQSKVLNLTTQTWSNIGGAPVDGATSVMYQPGKVLKVGTSTDADAAVRAAAATAYVLDANQGGATWRAVASMSAPRAYPTATMLPDGRVLITGGGRTTDAVGLSGSNPVLPAESWSPDTETWTPLASLHSPRLYHSTAMLLPDGRILVTGGGRFYGSPDPTDQLNAEIFVPPYLFRGPRPVITSAPAQLSYAQPFTVGTPDAARIVKAVLIRPASVTHNIDMNQAFVPVSFTVNGNTLDITAPANANIAPPGYYMLFLVDDQGVPSIAAFVRL
jgi:chitodextrinase